MRQEEYGEKTAGTADMVVLASVVAIALVNWAAVAGNPAVPAWKPWLSVTVTLVLALASLTRRPHWATALRAATALWIILAPLALQLGGLPYLVFGHVIVAMLVGSVVAWPWVRLPRRVVA